MKWILLVKRWDLVPLTGHVGKKNHAARVEQLAEIPSTTDRTLGGDFKQIEQRTLNACQKSNIDKKASFFI